MSSNFANCSMGTGILTYNGVDMGLLKNVKFAYESTVKDMRVKVPSRLVGSIVQAVQMKLSADLFEISPTNIATVCGGLTVQNNSSSPVTVAAHTPIAAVANFQGGPFYGALLAGPQAGTETLTLTDNSTALSSPADYTIVAGIGLSNGYLIFNPSGAHISSIIASGIHGIYTYTPITSSQVNFGASFPLVQNSLVFTHTVPGSMNAAQTGPLQKQVVMNAARPKGNLSLDFTDQEFLVTNGEWEAISQDTDDPTDPLGYFLCTV